VAAALRARLDEQAYGAAFAAGEAMSLDDAFALVDDDARFAAVEAAGGPATAAPPGGAPHAVAPGAPPGAEYALQIDVLGPFAMARDGVPVPAEALPVGKGRELLLYLLLHAQGTKEDIALALWPDATAAKARNTLHVTLHHLRRQLGDPRWIAFERGVYRAQRAPAPGLALDVDVDAVLAAAERVRDAARRHPASDGAPLDAAALAAARAALERLRGDLAEGATTEGWLAAHRDRVHGAWAEGMEALARLYADAGRPADALAVCERLVAREPLRETAHRQLIAALLALGAPDRARAHYDRLAARLARDVGVRPARETQALVDGAAP
jgi:DNA-binding SARP family transcriptional activator